MREIKFRAWVEEMVDVKAIDWNGDTYMPKPGIMDQRNDLYFFEDYPDMLMQFTGLRDRRGRDIYEGDLCIQSQVGKVVWHGKAVIEESPILLVTFGMGVFYGVSFKKGKVRMIREEENFPAVGSVMEINVNHYDGAVELYRPDDDDVNETEIIGNIHENKELLK